MSKATPTKRGKPAAAKKAPPITYSAVACTPAGELYCVQSPAGRSAKASLIVRHARRDADPEIVHMHGAKFHGIWVSPEGHCHAASNDGFHHTNETGTWTKTRVTKETFQGIGGVGDAFLLASSYPGRLFARIDGGAWEEILIGGNKASNDWFSSFAGSSARDVYAVSSSSVVHFDGSTWQRLPDPSRGPKSVVVLADDDVYLSGYTGLFRGNARSGFQSVAQQKLQYACRAADRLYCAAYTGGVFRWTESALEAVGGEDRSVWSMQGGPFVCATRMQPGIHTFDGSTWSVTLSD